MMLSQMHGIPGASRTNRDGRGRFRALRGWPEALEFLAFRIGGRACSEGHTFLFLLSLL